MRVRDHGAINRLPGIDVEVPGGTVQTLGGQLEGRGRVHRAIVSLFPHETARAVSILTLSRRERVPEGRVRGSGFEEEAAQGTVPLRLPIIAAGAAPTPDGAD